MQRSMDERFPWAGPALFMVVLAAVVVFSPVGRAFSCDLLVQLVGRLLAVAGHLIFPSCWWGISWFVFCLCVVVVVLLLLLLLSLCYCCCFVALLLLLFRVLKTLCFGHVLRCFAMF